MTDENHFERMYFKSMKILNQEESKHAPNKHSAEEVCQAFDSLHEVSIFCRWAAVRARSVDVLTRAAWVPRRTRGDFGYNA